MKPTFALTLSHESIGLLHRTPDGWLSIGSVATDDPDLAGALDYLRGAALGLEPQGFATKVVIPNSEILYDTVRAPGPKPAQRRAQIAAAIEGRTPYNLDELAFDWSGTGEQVQVAVVARETLAEAEAFATEHRFNPVSFVAMPDPGGFAAEPWFGLTSCAPDLLAPGEKVVRDQDPIRLVKRGPSGEAVATVDETEPAEPSEVSAPALAQVDPPLPAADPTVGKTPAEPEAAIAPADPDPAPQPPEPDVTEPALPAPVAEDTAADPAPVAPVAAPVDAVMETPTEPPPPAPVAAEIIPSTADAVADVPATAPAQPTGASPAEEPDQTLAWPGEDDAETLAQTKASLAASLAPPPVPAHAAAPALEADLPPPVAPSVQRALAAARAGREAPALRTVETGSASLTEKVQKAIVKTAKATKGKPKPPAPRPALAPPPPPLPPSATQPHVPPATSEAEKMTVFGERRSPVGGKPRFLGLMLTALLLLILMLVAVWAAMFLDPQQEAARPEAEAIAALAPTETPAAPAPDLPADAALPPAATEAEPAATAAPEAVTEAEAPEPVAQPEPAALDEPAPVVTTNAATLAGNAPATGPGAGAGIPLPQADEALSAPQRMELAAVPPGNADPAPAPPGALPEFGALYQFDAEGNILPTPEGVITPDGVRIVAGRPDRLPPPRPVAAVPDPAPQPIVTAPPSPGAIAILPQAEAPAPAAFQDDAAAPRRRPSQRPADLVVAPAPATPAAPEAPVADEGALPGLSPTSIAARRPAPRPASVLVAAEADRARAVAAAAAAAAASASTALAAEAGLPATRRPVARPADLARAAVAAAVAPPVVTEREATVRPAPEPEPVAAARAPRNSPRFGAHPDDVFDDGEPEAVSASPNIPTRASVARQATVTGALNLGRTNLIGVFGASNARYALVRESGGRLVRVKVGDRVDGGRVVAIGTSDLSYQRSGETVRLTMPRS